MRVQEDPKRKEYAVHIHVEGVFDGTVDAYDEDLAVEDFIEKVFSNKKMLDDMEVTFTDVYCLDDV